MSTNSTIMPHVIRVVRKSVRIARKAELWLEKPYSGSKFSKLIRSIFEHKNIHKILGSNLALAMIAGSVLQGPLNPNSKNLASMIEPEVTSETAIFVTQKGVQFPLSSVKINQRYSLFHPGVDLEGITGDPVHPIMAGRVESTQQSRFAYGNAIIINHGNNVTSLYAHLSKIEVKPGQDVQPETTIGLVGSTGHSTGDHLHIEIRDNGKPLNPLTVLPK